MDNGQPTTDKRVSVRTTDVGVDVLARPNRRLLAALFACLSVVSCLLSANRAISATADPCESVFAEIAKGLEEAKPEAIVKHFTQGPRVNEAIQSAVADPAMAAKLAQTFKTAKLKSAFDNKRIYESTDLEIGATMGIAGCVVQAW